MLRWLRGSREQGAGFTEYAAVILVIAAIAGAVLLAGVPGLTADMIRKAVCRVGNLVGKDKDCSESDQADGPKYNFNPDYCIKSGHKETVGGKLELGFFALGSEYNYAKETLSTGKVIVTMLPEMEAGVTTGAGGGIDFGRDSLKKKVDSSLKATLAAGNTFWFKNEKEFQKYKEDIEQARREHQQDMWGAGQGYQMGRAIGEMTGHYEPPNLPDPTIKSGTFGLKFNADGPLGTWANRMKQHPVAKKGEKLGLSTGDDWNLEVHGKYDVSKWYDEPGNTKTAKTYTFEGTGDLGVKSLGVLANGGISWNGATRVMRNEDGSLKNVRYTTTAAGKFKRALEGSKGGRSGKYQNIKERSVTQSVQIDFDTPEEQAIGERMLAERGLLPPKNVMESMANPLMDDQEGGTITQKPGPDAPDWEKLFYKRGKVWQYQSDVDKEEAEIGARAKLGLQFGASFGWGREDQRTTDAQILEGPQNGERRFIDYAPCVAGQPHHKAGD